MLHHRMVPLTPLQSLTGRNIRQSLAEAAPLTLYLEAEIDAQVDARIGSQPNAEPLPVNPHVLYAVAQTLKKYPQMNAHVVGDELAVYEEVNIGVALVREDGVIAPVVEEAASKTTRELAQALRSIMKEAQTGYFKPEDMRSATFTITDLSAYGIDAFTPALPLGKVGALGVGRSRPVLQPDGEGHRTVYVMTLSLTIDHRATDGFRAARFLAAVAERLAQPVFAQS